MRRGFIVAIALLTGCASLSERHFEPTGAAELFARDLVSTARSEVRLAISPDGNRMLWGVLEWPEGPGKWEIVESVRSGGHWSVPKPAAFNSAANDFDPSFAPDGSGVYFFSNRDGGLGGDDIYFAPLDGEPRNLGANINSGKDEWAPVVSPDGQTLLFASDGRGGLGKHDLFMSRRAPDGWSEAVNATGLNTEAEDFDATFLDDGHSIVLSSGSFEGAVNLFFVPYRRGGFGPRQRLTDAINSTEQGAWTFGPSITAREPGVLYFTSRHAINAGRADIYRIRYTLHR